MFLVHFFGALVIIWAITGLGELVIRAMLS
jgi:hypothetical protein